MTSSLRRLPIARHLALSYHTRLLSTSQVLRNETPAVANLGETVQKKPIGGIRGG